MYFIRIQKGLILDGFCHIKSRFLLLFLTCFLGGCSISSLYSQEMAQDLPIGVFEGNSIIHINDYLEQHSLVAFVFIGPECPLCENYTLPLKEIQETFDGEVRVVGVVPGAYYDWVEVLAFMEAFNFKVPVVMDREYHLTSFFDAKVTPEVFLYHAEQGLIYNGMIDNWIVALGKKRNKITKHYLIDAIKGFGAGHSLFIAETKAVGCIIE